MSNYVKLVVNDKLVSYAYYGERDSVIYPSIDKLLLVVDSKYRLVHIAARRSAEITDNGFLQKKDNEYVSKKNIGKSLEEVAEGLIKIKKD